MNPTVASGVIRYGGAGGTGVATEDSQPFANLQTGTWQEWVGLNNIKISTASTAAVIVRNAEGDWSLNHTSAGAETHIFAVRVPQHKIIAGVGWQLQKIHVPYQLGVVDATSVDLLCDSVAYVQATAPAVTAAHGGAVVDGQYDTNHNTAAKRKDHTVANGEHVMVLTLPTPVYFVTDNALVEVELDVVLASTGTFKLRGFGLEYLRTSI